MRKLKINKKQIERIIAGMPKGEPAKNTLTGINRNGPCYCGSGRKFKKCCWSKEQDARRLVYATQAARQPGFRDELAGAGIAA